MKNLTGKQLIAISIGVLAVLMVSTAQLQDVFGPSAAKVITSVAGLLNAILAGALTAVSSQTSLVNDVAAMPGVETITVNKNANQTLAAIAVDPAANNVETKVGDAAKVADIASGGAP